MLGPASHILKGASARTGDLYRRAKWRLRDVWPGVAPAWSDRAAGLRAIGRTRDAATVIGEALHRFPDDPGVLREAVATARELTEFDDRVALWRRLIVIEAGPHLHDRELISAYRECLQSLSAAQPPQDLASGDRQETGDACADPARSGADLLLWASVSIIARRWDEVFSTIDLHHRRHRRDLTLPSMLPDGALFELGDEAAHRRYRDPGRSCGIFRQIATRAPDNPHWWWLYVETLLLTGQLDEAAAILEVQKPRFPDFSALVLASGQLAMKREDWDGALEHLVAYQAVHPDDEVVREWIARARMERGAASQAMAADPLASLRQDVGTEQNEAVRSLLLGFENLGSDCEFGLVQRRFGAEPLGLFRWNATSAKALVDCLDHGLQGLGEPEHTVMSTFEDREYYLADTRWGFGFHTFMTAHEIEADKLFPKMCRRVAYLREKFLADLAEGKKTFVFKSAALDLAGARALYASLRVHGPSPLLWITTIERAHETIPEARPRGVHRLDDGLYLGLVSRFGNQPGKWDILFEEWIAICERIANPDDLPCGLPEGLR